MRYYAVAVGRQQRITTKYREFRYLVKGYPDAHYIVTDDYEKAEKYIKEYNTGLEKKDAVFYEETITYASSFINSGYSNKSVDNILWISSLSKDNGKTRNFDIDFQAYTETIRGISNAVSFSLKTKVELNLDLDNESKQLSENKDSNFYKKTISAHKTFTKEHNVMLLNSLTEVLNTLYLEGEDNLYVVTDSHFLTSILLENINDRDTSETMPLRYDYEIHRLYSAMSKFNKIFVSRYSHYSNTILHEKILTLTFNRCVNATEVDNE